MAVNDIRNIAVYEDNVNDFDIIQSIVNENGQQAAFYIADIGTVLQQHKKWISTMPRVSPHYAIKCNPNPTVIRVIAALNGRFDCASMQEIQQVIQAGVSSNRIIYANPAKPHSHISFARKVGVETMMVDNTMEVMKIKEIYPEAKLVIRVAIDSDMSQIKFSKKFGADPITEVSALMSFIKKQKMFLQGFSFHLGTPCWDPSAHSRGIKLCKKFIKIARGMGFEGVDLIDIGGGISGTDDHFFQKVAKSINDTVGNLDSSIKVISEPGRYYVEAAFTLATHIHSKKIIHDGETIKQHYYIDDGVYGSFLDVILGLSKPKPVPLADYDGNSIQSVIWGPTCDSNDCVLDDIMIQDLSVGDWIIWRHMGSYTVSLASTFNGYAPSVVFPIIRKTDLQQLLHDIQTAGTSLDT